MVVILKYSHKSILNGVFIPLTHAKGDKSTVYIYCISIMCLLRTDTWVLKA